MTSFMEKLMRRKVVDFGHSELRQVLGIVDLTMLGVGSTIGVGIYVLAGEVSRGTSGPAVTISFLIAGVASLFAGLCYAEFGARVPKAGSAYIYTYVCIGEFVAFIIGWNLILEYVIGTASVARGFSQYVDALANNSLERAFYDAMPLVPEENYNSSFLSPYPDFLSFGLAVLLSVALAVGVKESSTMNSIFTSINIVVITFVIIAAGAHANPDYWKIPEDKIDAVCNVTTDTPGSAEDWGTGGFVPFGFKGIMEGAATCFFGFVGFDVIATTSEEAINPSRTIPISIGLSLFIIFLSYFGVSTVITLAVPYCLQDEDAPLVALFDEDHIDWEAAKWFVSIGALFGFSASLFGAMFPLPRVIYAMASDGLVFRTLAGISKRFQTPTLATALAGLFAGMMAMLFNLDALVDMMSIGTLMAYSIVAVCVMLLRYKAEDEDEEEGKGKVKSVPLGSSSYQVSDYVGQLFNTKRLRKPTDLTASLVAYAILSYCFLVTVFDILLVTLGGKLVEGDGVAIAVVVIVGVINILNVLVIACQPQSEKELSFKVPFVPWLPAISTFINLYLMCNLKADTWIRFGVWMALGFLVYFAYGLWHSSLKDGGKPGQGLDNPGYTDDLRSQRLVIPIIEIQPATPLSSEPSTPVAKPKEQKTAPPPSPLVRVETQEKLSSSLDSEGNKSNENNIVGPISTVSAAAIVASLMMDDDKDKKDAKDADYAEKEKDTEDKEDAQKIEKKDEGTQGHVEKEEEKLRGNASPDKVSVVSEGESGAAAVSLPPTIIGVPQVPCETSASIEPTDARKDEEGTKEVEDQKTDDGKADEAEKPETKAEDKEDSKKEDATKGHHFKPPPLFFAPINLQNDNENEPRLMRAFYSSPELSPPHSPPPSPPPSSPASSNRNFTASSASHPQPTLVKSVLDEAHNRSVPTTPVGRRHPTKVLRRMSSFDDIPPSSPDSPFAKRISSFVVIPVREPGVDSNASSNPASPVPDLSYQDNLSKAVDVLNQYKKDEDKKMFTVGSADSLDSMTSDPGDTIDFLPPRRGLGYDLDVLDPIRERGESKIFANETDKMEVHLLAEDTSTAVLTDINSPNTTDTQEQEENK